MTFGAWVAAMSRAVVAAALVAPAPSTLGGIYGVVWARQGCGATTGSGCEETTTRLPHWRLRVARPGATEPEQVVTTARDGSFYAVVAPGDYLVSSAESSLAGLAETRSVKVGPGDCIRVELIVQLLRP
ncbi:MAG: hypothetical protein IPG77_24310 [Betaproteobacteria bacterium]|nr:hypothetical protein [Betaproteobacteria bacterium]